MLEANFTTTFVMPLNFCRSGSCVQRPSSGSDCKAGNACSVTSDAWSVVAVADWRIVMGTRFGGARVCIGWLTRSIRRWLGCHRLSVTLRLALVRYDLFMRHAVSSRFIWAASVRRGKCELFHPVLSSSQVSNFALGQLEARNTVTERVTSLTWGHVCLIFLNTRYV